MKLGVSESAIETLHDEQKAVEHGLKSSQAGDLLMVFADQIARTWKQIIYFKPDAKVSVQRANLGENPAAVVASLPGIEEFSGVDVELKTDGRGVYVAVEEAD
jgi:cyanophycin synthetase